MKQAFLFLLANVFVLSTYAQKLDKIIEKHIAAHGGEKKWEAVEHLSIKGKFTAFSIEKDFVSIKTNKGEYYSKHHLGKHEVVEAFNGEKGWTIDPWQELGFPRGLNKAEINVFLQKADFFSPFFKYKEKGHKVELIGKEDLDGEEVFALKVTRATGSEETWYLNAETYLAIKCVSMWVDFARASKAETFFDDYQKVDGLTLPFYTERTFRQRNRMMQIESVEVNSNIDRSLFDFPKEEAINEIAFLEGKWDVKVEIFMRGRWIPIDQTKADFQFRSENMLEEKICYDKFFPYEKTNQFSFNKQTGEYVVSSYNSFGSALSLFTGKMTDGKMKLEKKNMSGEKASTQLVFSEMKPKQFVLEIQSSNDEGKTWQTTDRFTYKKL